MLGRGGQGNLTRTLQLFHGKYSMSPFRSGTVASVPGTFEASWSNPVQTTSPHEAAFSRLLDSPVLGRAPPPRAPLLQYSIHSSGGLIFVLSAIHSGDSLEF